MSEYVTRQNKNKHFIPRPQKLAKVFSLTTESRGRHPGEKCVIAKQSKDFTRGVTTRRKTLVGKKRNWMK